jgi:UDP-sulfoquinovose synthase
MQGPVYGLMMHDDEDQIDYRDYGLQTHFYYDDLFGTVVNRFITQAMHNMSMSIYGSGTQKKGFISLQDAIACVDIATETPACEGELRVFNQITEVLSVQEIATIVGQAADIAGYMTVPMTYKELNPRGHEPDEDTKDYTYNVDHTQLTSLGLKPHKLSVSYVRQMMACLEPEIRKVNIQALHPRFNYGR